MPGRAMPRRNSHLRRPPFPAAIYLRQGRGREEGASGMAGRPSSRIGPLGLAALLAAVLTALRLAHGISWSWWWVLSPLWVLACILVLIFAGIMMTAAIEQYAGRPSRKGAAAPSAQRRQSSRPATADSLGGSREPHPARHRLVLGSRARTSSRSRSPARAQSVPSSAAGWAAAAGAGPCTPRR